VSAPVVPRRERFVIYQDRHTPAPYPRLMQLAGGRLVAGVPLNVATDYFAHGTLCVLVSADDGATWHATDDPSIPLNWPGSSARERWDRATCILSDGTWFGTGAVGWQAWPAERRAEAVAEGRFVNPRHPPGRPDLIGVGTNTVYVQRSQDDGVSWTRREVELPRAGWTLGLPRDIALGDGTLLLPLRQRSSDARRGHVLVLRVTPRATRSATGSDQVRVYAIPRDLEGAVGSEAALALVRPDRVLALIRADASRGGSGHLLASWSEDGGRTWSFPVVTDIWGRPPHLLPLADGRLVCTYGHQRAPLGVQAVVSADGGETWDVAHPAIVADDGGSSGLGFHPMSLQLPDGSIYTAYYTTDAGGADGGSGVPYSVGVRWELPW
jgi:hypothetical protein